MRIAIVGAGAIGGIVGAHLIEAGHDVEFVEVQPEHVEAIRNRGLKVTGYSNLQVRAPVCFPNELRALPEMVFLAVKSRHTNDAIAAIAPLLPPHGYVVSIQNGLEEYKIARYVGEERTIGAFLTFGGYYARPGEIIYSGPGSFRIGEIDGRDSARLHELVDVLSAFHPVEITDNIFGYLWGKEALGAMYYATALINADVVDIIGRTEYRPVLGELSAEVERVARSEGVVCESIDGYDAKVFSRRPRDPAAEVECWEAQKAYWTGHAQGQGRTGVWRDLAVHHRPTEVDHILVPIADKAHSRGILVPLLDCLIRMVKDVESEARSLSWDNLTELRRVHEEQYSGAA